ncbi:MAG: tripartite tricarboxylate transporter substrate binding protein [Candidatus Protistobacter heckmanni]|nr:tripartite tricarboxylate transporter substrate binding protein [Candidatus Protistobacter heckmanni]
MQINLRSLSARRGALGLVCGLALAALSLAAAPLQAQQNFPTQQVKIILSFPPGGTTDILARQLAAELMQKWGVSVIVDNQAGASGTIGSEPLMHSAPDGYTLMVTATHHVINPSLYKKLKYDTRKDFTPIALVATVPNVLLVHPSLPVKNVQELIKYAKEKPGAMSFGSAGTGGANHLSGELFKAMACIDIVHVLYKGAAPALNDLLGGQIPMMFDSLPGVIQQIHTDKLRPLSVTTLKRAAAAPEIPTIDEAGLKGFEATAWFGMYAPGGMAPELSRKINADVVEALKGQKIRALFAEQGADSGTLSQPDFTRFVNAEIDKWGKVIAAANVKLD